MNKLRCFMLGYAVSFGLAAFAPFPTGMTVGLIVTGFTVILYDGYLENRTPQ